MSVTDEDRTTARRLLLGLPMHSLRMQIDVPNLEECVAVAISQAEAAGYRRGIEAAAAWHDAEAQICERESERKYRESYTETSEIYQTHASNHRFAAGRIRALLPADKETQP